MLTKREKVQGTAFIWALPTSDWERKMDPEIGVFKYDVSTQSHRYESGAVKVSEHPISLEVPAGINLLERAIATLNEEKQRVLGEAQKKATEIQEQINGLLMITHERPAKEVEGEFLAKDDHIGGTDGFGVPGGYADGDSYRQG